MSLRLKITADELTRSFAVFDKTGSHSGSNPGGWGGPNPRTQDVTSSILEVEGPYIPMLPNLDPLQTALNQQVGTNTYVAPNSNGQPVPPINPLVGRFDLTGNFPNTIDAGYEILPTMFRSNFTKIVSGKWTIRWTVEGVDMNGKPFKAQTMFVTVFMNDVSCCVDKQLKNLDKYAFRDQKQKAIIELSNLLDAACYSKKCGLFDQADETIRDLNQQCTCVNC